MRRRIAREVQEWTYALIILACVLAALHGVQAITDVLEVIR
jgi:hypothetical protein